MLSRAGRRHHLRRRRQSGPGRDRQVKGRDGAYVIGVDSNQDALAPGKILTSMVKRVDIGVFRVSKRRPAQAARRPPRARPQGRRRRADRLQVHQSVVTPAQIAVLAVLQAAIVAGKIVAAVDAGGTRIVQARPALSLRGVSRRFGAVQAVDGVDLELLPGEIHALVGENGAGKSTLAAIAFGAVRPDEGTVEADGVVGLVHQHFKLIERLRVWENVLLDREPRKRLDDRRRRRARARARARRDARSGGRSRRGRRELPIGIKQRVELLRELDREPAVLLLDEPTAALAPTEIASFFTTVARAGRARHRGADRHAQAGRGDRLPQRVTVMRAGRVVARHVTRETSPMRSPARWSAARSPRSRRARRERRPRRCLTCARLRARAARARWRRDVRGRRGRDRRHRRDRGQRPIGAGRRAGRACCRSPASSSFAGGRCAAGDTPAARLAARHPRDPAGPPQRGAGARLERARQRRARPPAQPRAVASTARPRAR